LFAISDFKPLYAIFLPYYYYYCYYCFLWLCTPERPMASSCTRFRDNTQRRAIVGRKPLDECSARRRDLYLKTRNRQTSMPGGFRTYNRSRRAAVDIRLTPRGHWERHFEPHDNTQLSTICQLYFDNLQCCMGSHNAQYYQHAIGHLRMR
jgi:hypothetical protein